MKVALVSIATFAIVVSCSPYAGRIQTDHAREFGCEQRWVQVREVGEDRYEATGCGFLSEWSCRDRQCSMRDSRAYGMSAP